MSDAAGNDLDFLRQLRLAFQVEAGEHVQAIISGLLELEKVDDHSRRHEVFTEICREAHSLKGAARAVDHGEVEAICQSLEGVLGVARQQNLHPSGELFDSLHAAIRAIERNLIGEGGTSDAGDPSGGAARETSAVLSDLNRIEVLLTSAPAATRAGPTSVAITAPTAAPDIEKPADGGPELEIVSPEFDIPEPELSKPGFNEATLPSETETPSIPMDFSAKPGRPLSDTLRVSTAKLDSMLLQAEEMLSEKLNAAQRVSEIRAVVEMHETALKEWSRQATESGLGDAVAMAGSADLGSNAETLVGKQARLINAAQSHALALQGKLNALLKTAQNDRRVTSGMVDALVDGSKKLLMLPAATLMESFPRLVRELSRELGKEVELVTRGGAVEVDKRILEELKDPMMHLLRNSIDHGIESPPDRARHGKAARGTIAVTVSQVDGNKVQFLIQDDGAGIDPQAVRTAALRSGAITEKSSRQLSASETAALIFQPEVSTSPNVTQVSGRGMGMNVVKTKTQALGGRVEMHSDVGVGTSFRLVLPLTLAIFRGILIRSAGQLFVLPTTAVDRVVRIRREEVRTIENRETIRLLGQVISFARLDDVLELNGHDTGGDASGRILVIVVCLEQRRIAFQVDAVLNEQEVLFKRLGPPLSRVRNIAGATVVGTGKAVPVLNVDDLMRSASYTARIGLKAQARQSAPVTPLPARANTDAMPSPQARTCKILLVEDSITARMLEKNILESAGHQVKTAVDGLDALTVLRISDFDIVVSDVEMPRLDGFELTAKIRGDPRLADLPVILVTALASREHRERGAEAGANAYIVKSNFNQSDLLEAVQRLL